ncbi:SCY1 protein kinase [Puccinia striiformis f. sp. tritici PST-78]|uniref:SCY1 protein kinase n=1 Tax=Puccinia striiformis f. sp. tritici PST-78 TaxID=1165861 RepID=A0A0L0USD8_9BASI|nr:SCY1 protein kinase [Puccinia striiformis f. sp. tritici PST-78]
MSWLSVIGGAATSLLSKGGGIPNLPGFGLGSKESSFDGQTIWTQFEGIKREDNSNVSIFVYDSLNTNQLNSNSFIGSKDRKLLLGFAKNSLKKLRSLRHPDILKFIDGSETDSAVYIITEKVSSLSVKLDQLKMAKQTEVEWKIWGLSRIVSALKFLNGPGTSTHGNLRLTSIFITQSGEWKLSGFEVLSSPKDPQPILYTLGGLFPEAARYASPELMKTGYEVLKELDPACLDSYQLYLLIQTLFNNLPPSADVTSQQRGSIPPALFSAARRLASASPKSRLKAETFWEIGLGNGEGGGGVAGAFFRENRLIKVCNGLEGFSLASQGERASLVKSIKDSAESLPPEFLKFRVLPSLVQSFDHGADGPTLLPLAISISSSLSQAEFSTIVLQSLVKIFASPDRAIRLSLLELLPQYVDHLDRSVVVEKIWPNVLTGFTDTVPIIREATVKSVLLLAPKLSERILNNDLLRHLAKTQIDIEPGIRTNTCILLRRLSKSLSLSTCRKVLVPAFTRSVRDPFTPARIAGLMALMATVEYYEPDDLVGKVIPGMAVCLIDKEKTVRDQAFKALDMFLERVKKAASEMPETDTAPASLGDTVSNAISSSQPGMAMNATGAAGALASWAFSSVSRKLTSSELNSPDPKVSAGLPGGLSGTPTSTSSQAQLPVPPTTMARTESFGLVNAFTLGGDRASKGSEPAHTPQADWGGDLMNVEADADDWSTFETGPTVHEPSFTPLPSKIKLGLQVTNKPKVNQTGNLGTRMQLGQPVRGGLGGSKGKPVSTSDALVAALEADNELEGAGWGGDDSEMVRASSANQVGVDTNEEDSWNDASFDDDRPSPIPPKIIPDPSTSSSKESKAAHMAKMKEERRAKMAALKAKKASASAPPTES